MSSREQVDEQHIR